MIASIFKEKTARMFVLLLNERIGRKIPTVLAKEVDFTFSYAVSTIKKWEKDDLVTLEKKGRIQEISLTKKGYIIAQKIRQIINILQENEKENEKDL